MIDYASLMKNTGAYNTIKSDRLKNSLSHAYLVVIPDEYGLKEYLKVLAKLMVCKNSYPCDDCRECRLIDQEAYSDVQFYPEKEGAMLSSSVNKLIEESYFKPIESDKKILIVYNAHTMNAQAQNKLLKTLEEPPANVHIVLGATSEFPLLKTILSRVKKLEISGFSESELVRALAEECPDKKRLYEAISCGNKTVGKTLSLYGDQSLIEMGELAEELLINMTSSKEVLKYSDKITKIKCDLEDFLSVLEVKIRDLMAYYSNANEVVVNKSFASGKALNSGFNQASCIYALEKIAEAKKRKNFNANALMLIEWTLFQILEGKHKWQKL